MKIDSTKSVVANLIAAINASATKIFAVGDVTFGNPAVKVGSDQTASNAGVNSTIGITGVQERGFRGTITRDYRRVPLDAPVGGALQLYTVPEGTTVAQLLAIVAADRKIHPALTYTVSPAFPSGLGAAGTTGTITFNANAIDPLHVGSVTVNYQVTAP